MKHVRYVAEAILLYILYGLFWVLPVRHSSGLGAWIGRTLGPRLKASETARDNILRAFPEKNSSERDNILRDMWDNLGRVLGEYPHLDKIARTHIKDINPEIIEKAADSGRPLFLISGHIANWEVMALHTAYLRGHMYSIYREPNNPYVARLLKKARNDSRQTLIPKSRSGTRKLVRALKNKEAIGLLFDQKYNEGIPVPFFGHDAMTGDAFLHLAQKYDALVIPGILVRTKGSFFSYKLFPPLDLKSEDGTPRSTLDILTDANMILENFIKEHPGQWLWLHRRWPSEQ